MMSIVISLATKLHTAHCTLHTLHTLHTAEQQCLQMFMYYERMGTGEGEKIGSKYVRVKSDFKCMGLCWQISFWMRMCALLRMHTAIAGLRFELMILWLMWAKNAVGEHVLDALLKQRQDNLINDTEEFQDVQNGYTITWI